MFCPRCGQEQHQSEVRFCSRCGFLMTGMGEVVRKGGLPQEILDRTHPNAVSPKKRGLKQGGLMMLAGLIIVPLLAIISATLDLHPALVAVTAIVSFWGGVLRMIYALVFESGTPTLNKVSFSDSVKQTLTGKEPAEKALPPQQTDPIPASYHPPAGNWRDTKDLQPTSVTEETTRTLDEKEL